MECDTEAVENGMKKEYEENFSCCFLSLNKETAYLFLPNLSAIRILLLLLHFVMYHTEDGNGDKFI